MASERIEKLLAMQQKAEAQKRKAEQQLRAAKHIVLCFDDCPDAGIGKHRHGFHFRTAPLMKRPSHPSRVAGFFYAGAKRMMAQMRRNNRVEERTFDSSTKRAFCTRETPVLKNYGKNDQMNMNFRDFLRLGK